MIVKPFRPPSFVRLEDRTPDEPPTKKRRTSSERSAPVPTPPPSTFQLSRKPLVPVSNTVATPTSASSNLSTEQNYYTVLWRKFTTKKNKTWDGDGVLAATGAYAVLSDSNSGKELGKGPCSGPLLPGSTLSVGGKDVEIDEVISKEDYMSGRIFLGKPPQTQSGANVTSLKGYNNVKPVVKNSKPFQKPKGKRNEEEGGIDDVVKVPPPSSRPLAARAQFKTPLLSNTVIPKTTSKEPQARHDPHKPNALVMKRPASCSKGKQIVDVVVDPVLGKHLRDHQREGVKFLYECVMGMRSEGEGAILADEMGLGKTLQTITLIWTLLKQNPIYEAPPVVTKALIVCPAGLVDNWRREFRKWLGNEKIGVFVAEGKKNKITDFTKGKAYNIMIIGYEMLRVVQDELKKGSIDIVIADEGHRLKTANNKAMLAIQSLNTERRIILSGTPLQNDLGEFFTAIDFVNPGLLGKRTAFRREFENPIVKSRQPNASESEVEKGEARWKELVSLTSRFMIRRTADVLTKYLPPKTEHIIFCKPTKAQAAAYRSILTSPFFAAALGNSDMALQLITVLKKVCNSPSLLQSKDADDTPTELQQSLLPLLPPKVLSSHASSTKLRVLDTLLHKIYTTTEEKVVIVSNYTQTLDMVERLLTSLSYTFLRLDGSTPTSKRQPLVDKFNRDPKKISFAFLLSAKSGGVGLNLVGASRIILFDIDWNPATDLQAMARIHRDGQKRPCKIYRFLVQGALDEKIYQRQVMKMSLANAVVDNKASASTFSREELQDLFRLDERETPQTHDLLGCTCEGHGGRGLDPLTPVDLSTAENLDEDSNILPGWNSASEIDVDAQEACLKRPRKPKPGEQPKLRMLMEYKHLDTRFVKNLARAEQETSDEAALLVDDDVLLEVMKEDDGRVGWVLTKSSS